MGTGDDCGHEAKRICVSPDLPDEIAAGEWAKFVCCENDVGHFMPHGVERFGGMLEGLDPADADGGEHGAECRTHWASVVDHRDDKQIEITA